MKLIMLMNGKEIVVSDEEAGNIANAVENTKFITLRSGDFINVSSISCILDYPGILVADLYSGRSWEIEMKRIFTEQNGNYYYVENGKKHYLETDKLKLMRYIMPDDLDKIISEQREVMLLEDKSREEEQKMRIEREKEENRLREEERAKKIELWNQKTKEERIEECKKQMEEKKGNEFFERFMRSKIERIENDTLVYNGEF